MKIIKFEAENIKRLKAVSITPQGNVIEVTGQNGHGKSSVLDAVYYGLCGQSVIPQGVVREGEEKAFVKLDLGDLIVTRKFTAGGTTSLIVESVEGARFPSPQTMLDQLVGSLSFDPLQFARMKPEDQHWELQKLVPGLSLKLAELYDEEGEKAAARRDINREVKRLEAQVAGLQPQELDNVPDEPVDVTALVTQMNIINDKNTELNKRKSDLKSQKWKIEQDLGYAKKLRADAEELVKKAQKIEDDAISQSESLDISVESEQLLSNSDLVSQITDARTMNQLVDRKKFLNTLTAQLAVAMKQHSDMKIRLEEIVKMRKELFAEAKFPIDGLTMSANNVTYQGRDLALASDAEKLRVSVVIAMATNPKLRVLRIKDGSLLDENGMKMLTELADTNDYQLWIERVEDSHGRPCVVMTDGSAQQLTSADDPKAWEGLTVDEGDYGAVGSVPGE